MVFKNLWTKVALALEGLREYLDKMLVLYDVIQTFPDNDSLTCFILQKIVGNCRIGEVEGVSIL